MIAFLVMVPVGYVLGSVPFGLIVGRLVKRVDVRDFGSGKTGMTNVLRTVGAPAAVGVLLLDMGKGIAAVVLTRMLFDSAGAESASALAALAGHIWPVFAGFRGGRGTAPGWGALLVLSPVSGLVATLVGGPAVGLTRYVSLGSSLGAASGALAIVVLGILGREPTAYIWYGAVGGTLVLLRHRDNILRLVRGQEHRIGQPAGPSEQGEGGPGRRGNLRWPRSA